MPGSQQHTEPARHSPTAQHIAAFVDARRGGGGQRRGARALRLRLPNVPPALRAVLIGVIAWVGIAQWVGFFLRLLRMSVEG